TQLLLLAPALLLVLAVASVVVQAKRGTVAVGYGACAVVCVAALAASAYGLLAGSEPDRLVLPLGIPWIGAHFAIDPLALAFLVIVNLGAAAASLYGVGYGRHEEAPLRVFPFFAVFLAGMNLVVLADDAFTF